MEGGVWRMDCGVDTAAGIEEVRAGKDARVRPSPGIGESGGSCTGGCLGGPGARGELGWEAEQRLGLDTRRRECVLETGRDRGASAGTACTKIFVKSEGIFKGSRRDTQRSSPLGGRDGCGFSRYLRRQFGIYRRNV